MQSSKTCQVADHQQKVIEYVCVYPQCNLSRFLCSKCTFETIHKHNQQDNSHFLDSSDFCDLVKKNLDQAQGKQQQNSYYYTKLIFPLKQLIQEIQNLLENIQNITQQLEQGQLEKTNINHLENQLLNIQKYGFNQIDDQSLNNSINIPEQQQDLDIYKQLEDQANQIIQNASKIKEWRLSEVVKNQISLTQKIKDAKYQINQIDNTGDKSIYTGTISNDLKYIVSGGNGKQLKIWDYQSNELIESIKLNDQVIWSCKFTDDSTLLYAGTDECLYQFDVNNQFKQLYQYEIHHNDIHNIYCISNTIILTSSTDKTIIKTDVTKQQQLLKIYAGNNSDHRLDYNKSLNIIASASDDKSIKLWNANDGSLIIERLNAHNNDKKNVMQVLFIINNNQLISLNSGQNLIIWNINYQTKQLEQLQQIENFGLYISLVLQQQYIIATSRKDFKVYSIQGDIVRQFDHVDHQIFYYPTVPLDSMKAVLIVGMSKLQVYKFEID